MRGWTWIDEDSADVCECDNESCDKCSDDETSAIKRKMKMELIQKLCAEWNDVHSAIERRSWRSREDRYDEEDYHAERVSELEDEAIYEAEQKNPALTKEEKRAIRQKVSDDYDAELLKQEQKIYLKQEAIEELLRDLGVRMMRPYEHWNEDERYMEYMETRYDDPYGDYDY